MSNALVKDGKPWNGPLFGNGGAIKDPITVINPFPKTVAELVNNYLQDVDVSRIKSFANRDTKVRSITKILSSRGGIDGSLYSVRGAVLKNDPSQTVWVYDGDHTRHLWMACNPSAETMPMHVTKVETMQQVNELFVLTNKTGKTKITTEQEFVNNYHAGCKEVEKQTDFAKKVDLFVYCNHEKGGRVGQTSGFEVKVNTLKKLISACQSTHLSAKEAVSLVSEMTEFDDTKPIHLHLTLALTMLNESFPSLIGKQRNKFRAWFKGYTNNHKLNDVVTLAQSQCGQAAIGSQNTYFVASGILKLLKQQKIEGLKSFRSATLEKKFS